MRIVAVLAAVGAITMAATNRAPAAAMEQVEIAAGATTLKAMLIKPDGAGPFPVIVGMHGCDGLINPTGALAARYRDWADHLGKAGFAVLFPDSYGSRGLTSQCRNRATILRTNRDRVADANAARAWLQSQPFAKPDHISLMGWSNGGISVLWAVRPNTGAKDKNPDFRTAVAMYPGCNRLDATAWSARIPTLILIGAADDWSSAKQCEQMVSGARGRSARTQIVVYPGAYHDFDHPSRVVQIRTGYAFSVDGSGKIHTGTNPIARNDALRRVPQWLGR